MVSADFCMNGPDYKERGIMPAVGLSQSGERCCRGIDNTVAC